MAEDLSDQLNKPKESNTEIKLKSLQEVVNEAAEEPIIELGDRVRLNSSTAAGLVGTVIYRSQDLIGIRPDGVVDSSREFQLSEEGFDPELGIESVDILQKRKKPSFIEIFNLQKDHNLYTYDDAGKPYRVYTIKDLDLNQDVIQVEDTEYAPGDTMPIDFRFIGVPRDLPFRVVFDREPPETPMVSTAENEGNAEAEGQEGVEGEEEEIEDFTFLDDELEEQDKVPAFDVEHLIEIPSSERQYPDITQKSEAYADLLSLYSPAKQQLRDTQHDTQILVELFFRLRSSVLRLSQDGFPIGVKPTSIQTLADALETRMLALSRCVVDIHKVLFIDSTEDGGLLTNDLHFGEVGPIPQVDKLVLQANYLYTEDAIKYLDESTAIAGTKFNAFMNGYLTRFGSTWSPGGSEPVHAFQQDEEVLRLEADSESSTVPGFDQGLPSAKEGLVDPGNLSTVPYDFMRVLKATTHKGKIVQPGEEAAITSYIVFPYKYASSLSTQPQESLAADVRSGLKDFKNLNTIWTETGEISEIPSTNQMFRVSVDGGTLGNIPLREYLTALNLRAEGMGDIWPLQILLGMREREWTIDQQQVLQDAISNTQNLILAEIVKQREQLATLVSQPPSVQGIQMVPDAAVLIDKIAGEQTGLLLKIQNDIREQTPSYANSDVALVGLPLRFYPDLCFAQLSDQAAALTKAKNAFLRDEYIKQVDTERQFKARKEFAGVPPEPNRCKHVKNLLLIRKVKDDSKRMALMVKFLTTYQGEKRDNWVNCVSCEKELVCMHELLQIYQFLRPGDVDVLNKEIQLNYGGGQFQGYYICRTCGQPIKEVEFDTHVEFDDNGRPMMGRSVLLDTEKITEEQIEELLGPVDDIGDDVSDAFDNETKKLIYRTAKEMSERLFTPLTKEDFVVVVNRVAALIQQIPSRERYVQYQTAQRKGKSKGTMPDYDVYMNQALVCAVGVHLLLSIQTHVPDLILRNMPSGCRNLGGQPLETDGQQGIQCIITVIAALNKDSAPWNLTQFQKITDPGERQKVVMGIFEPILQSSLQDPTILQALNQKREYRKKILGAAAGEGLPDEKVPENFLPIPYQQGAEEFVEKVIVPEAASMGDRVELWVRQGNTIAKQNKMPMPIVFSETSCCLSPLDEVDEFWRKPEIQQSLPRFNPRTGVPPPPKITKAEPIMKPAQLVRPLPDAPEESYYQLFLKVCASSDDDDKHKGYSHEFGLTHKCIWCGLQLPAEPELLTPEVGRSEVEKQGIDVSKESFEDLLNATHKANSFKTKFSLEVPGPLQTWNSLKTMNPPPVEGWREMLAKTDLALSKLAPDAEEVEVALALTDFSTLALETENNCKIRLPKNQHGMLDSIVNEGAESIVRFLQSYLIVPIRRFMAKMSPTGFMVPKSWDLESFHRQDVQSILAAHNDYLIKFQRIQISRWLKSKLQAAVDQTREIIKFLQKIRPVQIPGGKQTYDFFLKFCLFAPLANFVDPNILPALLEEGVEVPASQVEEQALFPARFISDMIKRFFDEGFRFTPEQIRELIAKRSEMEKDNIIKKINAKDRSGRDIEKMMMKFGIGEYAVGGTSAIWGYNKEQIRKEREQRAEMGLAPEAEAKADGLGYYGDQEAGEGYIGDGELGEINGFDDDN
jgi:hypothetical protein